MIYRYSRCAHYIHVATRTEFLHNVIIGMPFDITTPDAVTSATDEASDDEDSSTASSRSSDSSTAEPGSSNSPVFSAAALEAWFAASIAIIALLLLLNVAFIFLSIFLYRKYHEGPKTSGATPVEVK